MLRWGKGGYVKGAVLEIANNKYLLGEKSSPPGLLEEAASGLPLPSSRWKSLLQLLFVRQKSPDGLYALWAGGAGTSYKVPEILITLPEQILHTAETVSQDLKKKKQH